MLLRTSFLGFGFGPASNSDNAAPPVFQDVFPQVLKLIKCKDHENRIGKGVFLIKDK